MRDRLVIIDAVKELMQVEWNTRERVVEMVVESHKVHRGTIYAYLSDESSIRLNKPVVKPSTQKVQSHGSGRPPQLSRPSWFPLSRGYCFSWCAKQKRHQRTKCQKLRTRGGREFTPSVWMPLRQRIPQKKPAKENNRFIFFIQNYRNLFHPVSQLKSRQPTNFYQEKNVTFLRCELGSGGEDLALEVRTWEMRKNEKIKSSGPKSEDLDICMYT